MKRARVFKLAKGYYGRSKNCFTIAVNRVQKGLLYAYRGRKLKKRLFRQLWITQTSAACRQHGLYYSEFIYGLQKENIKLNRKMLALLAITEPYSFWALTEHVKKVIPWRSVYEKQVLPHLPLELTPIEQQAYEKQFSPEDMNELFVEFFKEPLQKAEEFDKKKLAADEPNRRRLQAYETRLKERIERASRIMTPEEKNKQLAKKLERLKRKLRPPEVIEKERQERAKKAEETKKLREERRRKKREAKLLQRAQQTQTQTQSQSATSAPSTSTSSTPSTSPETVKK
jgi:large subunit ribosomal protein L20